MGKYKIIELIGKNCITLEDGQKIYDLIYPELTAGHTVELDFTDVKIFISRFFNAAIGQLLKDITPDVLNKLLKFENLSPVGKAILKQVIENSKRYYYDENYRKAVDEVLIAQGESL